MPFAALSWLPAWSLRLCGKATGGWRSGGGLRREAQTLLCLVFPSLFLPRLLQQGVGASHSTQGGFFGVKGFSDEQEQWMSLSLGQWEQGVPARSLLCSSGLGWFRWLLHSVVPSTVPVSRSAHNSQK